MRWREREREGGNVSSWIIVVNSIEIEREREREREREGGNVSSWIIVS